MYYARGPVYLNLKYVMSYPDLCIHMFTQVFLYPTE